MDGIYVRRKKKKRKRARYNTTTTGERERECDELEENQQLSNVTHKAVYYLYI